MTVMLSNETVNFTEAPDTFDFEGNGNTLNANAGDDIFTFSGNDNIINLDRGLDSLIGFGDDNTLRAGGGEFGDTIKVKGDGNLLEGSNEDDLLVAMGDGNLVRGAEGTNVIKVLGENNTVYSGSENDTIISSLGGNELYGGAGNDTFVIDISFNPNGDFVEIKDFNEGDKIVVLGASSNSSYELKNDGSLLVDGQKVAFIACPPNSLEVMFDNNSHYEIW